MIFLLAGTQDGRELCKTLLQAGYAVTASVTTQYGEQLLAEGPQAGLTINDQPLDATAMAAYLRANRCTAVVDASHPYAVEASRNAIAACDALTLPYVRYERPLSELHYEGLTVAHSCDEAAVQAAQFGERVFITTGSHTLTHFTRSPSLQREQLIVRVLPTAAVLQLCEQEGLTPRQIIAMQGPFSLAMNELQFKEYDAEVIVTKNSGAVGGTDAKIAAAAALGLPVVVVDRPRIAYPAEARSFAEVMAFIKKEAAHA